jgi:hypothetical protein
MKEKDVQGFKAFALTILWSNVFFSLSVSLRSPSNVDLDAPR